MGKLPDARGDRLMAGPRPDDPYNPVPQVSPSTQAPNDYLQVRADPGAFGGQIGEAQQGLGKAIQGVGDEQASYVLQKQGMANENEANTADGQYAIESGKKYNQFKNLSGIDASNAKDQAAQAIVDLKDRIKAGLSNPASQRAFDLLATRRMSFTVQDIYAYAADQQRQGYRKTIQDQIKLAQDDASRIEVAKDPVRLNDKLVGLTFSLNHLYTAPEGVGFSSVPATQNKDGTLQFDTSTDQGKQAQAAYDNDLSEAKGVIYTNAAKALATNTDPNDPGSYKKAGEFLDKYKDDMPAKTYRELSVSLRSGILGETIHGNVQNIIAESLGKYQDQFKTPESPSSASNSDLTSRFIQQESGGTGTNLGQIQPGTWKEFAKPGEDINNPADNKAVTKRILDKYNTDYNGDIGRIATAYFSGPGNVASSGSTPYVNGDLKDSNGKSVSSYVQDIQNRTGSKQVYSNGYQSPADHLGLELPELIQKARDSVAQYGAEAQDEAARSMYSRVQEQISYQNAEVRAAKDYVYGKIVDPKSPITNMNSLLFSSDSQLKDNYMTLSKLDPYSNLTISNLIKGQAEGASKTYGTSIYDHLISVLKGDEDPDKLGEYIGGDKSPISVSGYKMLSDEKTSRDKSPLGKSFAGEEAKFLENLKSHFTSVIPGIKTPALQAELDKQLPVIMNRIQAGRNDSTKNSNDLFDPNSKDYVGKGLIYPSKAQITAAATTASIQASVDKNLPVHLKDISDPNQGIVELHKRVKSGEATPREAADYAIQRGWRKSSKVDTGPQVPRPE